MSNSTTAERTSLAIVPRERWSLSVRSLKAALDAAPDGVELVYVDGGSPDVIRAELEEIVTAFGGVFIRRDYVLVPNEARNLALARCTRDYIVMADNDIIPKPGWLEALVDCADETGADVVGPLIMQGANENSTIVHIAGGHIEIRDGRLEMNEHHHHWDRLDQIPQQSRCESNQLEFHSILMRRSVLDDIGPFDEEIKSMADHEDFVLLASQAGHKLWFEPDSVITYLQFAPLTVDDRRFWQFRWCEDWNTSSLDHFAQKWDIRADVGWPAEARRWSGQQRMWWYHRQGRLMTFAGKVFRDLAMIPVTSVAARVVEERVFCRQGRVERKRRAEVLITAR